MTQGLTPVLLLLSLLLAGCNFFTEAPTPATPQLALPDFTQLVKNNAASVVNISTSSQVEVGGQGDDQGVGNILRQLFGDQLGGQLERRFGQPPQARPHKEDVRSLGSGFILSKDGYILTNYHVVRDADSIMVRLSDRRELSAKLVGKDAQTDIALLKIDAKNLQPVTIGKSDALQVGEWVLAIGAPFGFDSSVTAGIVSAKSRSLPDENYVPFIQTDVPINPGNSGGPLFNLKGEVVGINSQIVSRSGGYMGLSFAIPIDLAMKVVTQLKAGKQVARGWLGVMIQEVTHDLAQSFGLDRPMGALVARVSPDSPAAKAGIKAGDVIVAFNGKPVDTAGALPPLVGLVSPGDKAELELVRHGKHETLTVTIGQLPAELDDDGTPDATSATGLGLKVAPLSEADKSAAEVAQGVKVVTATGAAAAAGISAGDIIQSINNEPVTDVASFDALLHQFANSQTLALLINHQGDSGFVVVRRDAAKD